MITAGIDVGIEKTKVVVLKDDQIIGYGISTSGGALRNEAAKSALETALKEARVSRDAVERIVATGKGKYDVTFADDYYTEIVCLVSGVKKLCPEVTTVVSFGADEILAATDLTGNTIGETVLNQKCSAGLGTFLRTMARRLNLSLEEMGNVDISDNSIGVGDGCIVFAELGALSMLNNGEGPKKVAAEITKAAAVRAATVLNDIITIDATKVVYVGGLTNNKAFMDALYNRYNLEYTIAPNPEYVCALGAAVQFDS